MQPYQAYVFHNETVLQLDRLNLQLNQGNSALPALQFTRFLEFSGLLSIYGATDWTVWKSNVPSFPELLCLKDEVQAKALELLSREHNKQQPREKESSPGRFACTAQQ